MSAEDNVHYLRPEYRPAGDAPAPLPPYDWREGLDRLLAEAHRDVTLAEPGSLPAHLAAAELENAAVLAEIGDLLDHLSATEYEAALTDLWEQSIAAGRRRDAADAVWFGDLWKQSCR